MITATPAVFFRPLQAGLLSAGLLSLALFAPPAQSGPANTKPVAPTPVTPSTTQYAGLSADARCSGQYSNAINATTNASLGLQIGGVAAQAAALVADGVGLGLEAAGASTLATPAMIPGIIAQGVALVSNVAALGMVSAALASDLSNAILSQEAAKLPQCDTVFASTLQVSNGGLIAAGNSHFSNSIGVVENVNVGGVVKATNLWATNSIAADLLGARIITSQSLVNEGLLTTTDLAITGQLSASNLSVSNFVAQGDMATVGIVNRGSIATDSLTVSGQISSHGLVNAGHLATTTFSATGLSATNGIVNTGVVTTTSLVTNEGARVGTTLSVGSDATVGGNLSVAGGLSAGTAFSAGSSGSFLAHGQRVVAVDSSSASMSHGANRVTVNAQGVELAGGGAQIRLSGAQVEVVNATGHGMTVSETQTVISGGSSSTSLQLDDQGARFFDASSGGPARVSGIADGVQTQDAVNVGQLRGQEKRMAQGIASTAAIANIPALEHGKSVALGVGVGHFNGASALAFAGSLRLSPHASFRASLALNGGQKRVVGAGANFSW